MHITGDEFNQYEHMCCLIVIVAVLEPHLRNNLGAPISATLLITN